MKSIFRMSVVILMGLFMAAPATIFAVMEPATPESQGVSSEAILKWIDACEKTFNGGTSGNLHGFVIVRHGKVIAEGSWKPFDTLNETHMLYSHSKSFTSSAIGFLVDEGKLDLDERIVDIFTNEVPLQASENLAQLRVRDLLTMNVGSENDHTIYRHPQNWLNEFFKKPITHKPGTYFRYDSDATYVLAAIVEKKSGEKMMAYLKRKMFDKIGITKAWTSFSPEGIPCGGWGMNMTTRELARFGQLYLNRGEWNGEQILSSEWVALATMRQTWSGAIGIVAGEDGSDWHQGYGFQFWRCVVTDAYRADGAYGQYTIIFPQQDAVVSIHAGVCDMQKELDLIWANLLPGMKKGALPENDAAQAALRDRLSSLKIQPAMSISGQKHDLSIEVHHTFKKSSQGFAGLHLNGDGKEGWIATIETRAGKQRIPVGDGSWAKGAMRIDTENYERLGAHIGEQKTAASGGFCADGTFHLKLYLTGTPAWLDVSIDQAGEIKGFY